MPARHPYLRGDVVLVQFPFSGPRWKDPPAVQIRCVSFQLTVTFN